MAKKRKGRSVKKNPNRTAEPNEYVSAPHSFVIHKGLSGGSTLDLTKDFRRVMEPFTASSLKERKRNTIKDFVSVAGPLHVTHLCVFSQTELGMYMKMMRLPRGPTLTFKINNFSLAKDVVSSLKKQAVVEEAFKTSPLLVLNSFSGEGMQMKMMASMFQHMFPTINLTSVDLNKVRRCVLINYNPSTKLIDFRHYNIKVVPVGVSKGVKKVVQGKVPNLSRCTDISEFFTKSAFLSESEAEDLPQNHVTLTQEISSRGNVTAGKSAIRLSELGPRMALHLIKIEDGLLNGEVLFHDVIHKTEEEKSEITRRRAQKSDMTNLPDEHPDVHRFLESGGFSVQMSCNNPFGRIPVDQALEGTVNKNCPRALKEKRKTIQEKNKKAKEDSKKAQKEKMIMEANEEMAEDDDKEYYRQEVGEEPDADLFASKSSNKRKAENECQQKFKTLKVFHVDSKHSFKVKKYSSKKNRKDTSNFKNRDTRPIG